MGVCKRCDSKGVGRELGFRKGKERIYTESTEFAEGTERKRKKCELRVERETA